MPVGSLFRLHMALHLLRQLADFFAKMPPLFSHACIPRFTMPGCIGFGLDPVDG